MSTRNNFQNPEVEVIGHRGHVSAYPENTLEGFVSALKAGAEALEMDLVISADRRVVVSHEPYMKSTYMLTPEGKVIKRSKEKDYKLYEMTYDSIRKFHSGSLKNRKFRNQRSLNTFKPLLEEVFDTVEACRVKHQLKPVKYYLEIKSDPQDYEIFQPQPEEFAELVMQVILKRKLEERIIIQSFDATLLNLLKQVYPKITVSYLLHRTGFGEGIRNLTFTPEILSPYFKQLKKAETVIALRDQGIKVVPWTVNSRRQIRKMINLGVDGIISDYPERVLQEKEKIRD